jgi:asparagine synthase (glutamine-hydrolysing)
MWMGHRRLSIYDLSDSGTQPFSDAASGWHVAINGTHHGAAHVRKQLLSQGVHLRSGSDCELLLPLLQRDGPEAIDSFQGPFAIAAFHEASRTLWLARDAAGEKPLYYALTEDALIFASELKPLRMLLQAPKIDAEAASTFLRLGWLPAPHTILAGVLQVPPGVRIAFDGNRTTEVPMPPAAPATKSGLDDALAQAVASRLTSERRTAIFLSSGVDSACIAALAADAGYTHLPTISLGFANPEFDESALAAETARALGFSHERILYDADPLAQLQQLITLTGEPLGDPSLLALDHLCAATRERATIALTGDGGDELFLGYRRYGLAAMATRLPRMLRPLARTLGGQCPSGNLRRMLLALGEPRGRALLDFLSLLDGPRYRRVFKPPFAEAPHPLLAWFEESASDPSADSLALAGARDFATYLPFDLCRKSDQAASTHGMEIWAPFLDPRVVQAARSLPSDERRRGKVGKLPLRRFLQGRVPEAVLKQRKRGFAFPLPSALAKKNFAEFLHTVTECPPLILDQVLREGSLKTLHTVFLRGDTTLAPFLFAVAGFALLEVDLKT